MSRTPRFFVENFNPEIDKYELQHPYVWNDKHTRREAAELYPYNGDHDLFSIVENDRIGVHFPELYGIHKGLPKDVSNDIRKEFYSSCYENDYGEKTYLHTPDVYWFTYADMYIYCLEHPEVIDEEAMDEEETTEKIMMPNPLTRLKERVDTFLEVTSEWGGWRNNYSQIRIVYWIE